MRFFSLIASAAFAAVALAQSPVKITNNAVLPKAGETIKITYEPANVAVTLILKNGDGKNLQTVKTIGTSSNGSIDWTPEKDIPNDLYSLEIKPATGDSNYIGPFRIQGATASVVASTASSTRSASASSSVSSGSVTSSASSSSASASVSASHNGTVTSATLSTATTSGSRPTGSGASQTTGSAPPTNTNAAGALSQSPLALVFGALAAFAYLA